MSHFATVGHQDVILHNAGRGGIVQSAGAKDAHPIFRGNEIEFAKKNERFIFDEFILALDTQNESLFEPVIHQADTTAVTMNSSLVPGNLCISSVTHVESRRCSFVSLHDKCLARKKPHLLIHQCTCSLRSILTDTILSPVSMDYWLG